MPPGPALSLQRERERASAQRRAIERTHSEVMVYLFEDALGSLLESSKKSLLGWRRGHVGGGRARNIQPFMGLKAPNPTNPTGRGIGRPPGGKGKAPVIRAGINGVSART